MNSNTDSMKNQGTFSMKKYEIYFFMHGGEEGIFT